MTSTRALAFLVLLAACDCSSTDPTRPCTDDSECAGDSCIDGFCEAVVPDAGRPDTPGSDIMSLCMDPEIMCGGSCCPGGELCMAGRCVEDCGAAERCGSMCCGDGTACEDDRCVAVCDDITDRCGTMDELCCTSDQACLASSCVDLGVPCEFTEDCAVDEICLPSESRCVPRDSVDVCEFRPPVGEFSPTVGCRWTPPAGAFSNSHAVVMTPSVANLSDDNEDGDTNTEDIPDIVFASYVRSAGCCQADAVIRIVSGLCNDDGTMNTLASLPMPAYDNSNGILLANLHPDTMADERNPEIVASFRDGTTLAWRRTADDGSAWEEMWRTDALTTDQSSSGAQPGAADFNGDGQPEVYVGNVVLNGLTGEILWNGDVTVGPNSGVGNNAFLGPVSTAADLDLDGNLELIAGNTVYNGIDGSEIWTFEFTTSNGNCGGGARGCDGYDAVGNFDDDDEGEVVIVRQGEVFVIGHDGVLQARVPIPVDDCPSNESGPPTIADFDGDGRAEIGTAGADFYVVVDLDCIGDPVPDGCDSNGILWKAPNNDCSSRATGSSVFDFEGDGAAEVVYADEQNFRIFDGATGRVLYDDDTHASNTRMEMPIVVDVDNDGKSEVIVPEPNLDRGLGGIEIWEDVDNNWVRTRRIWNQHAYHVTNITEDGQVPRREEPNWLNSRLNNFRQNVQPGGLFDAPDLIISEILAVGCAADSAAQLRITVRNNGALGVAAGVPVAVYATLMDGTEEFVGVTNTTRFLLPGQAETVTINWLPSEGWTTGTFSVRAVVDSDGMGGSTYNECDEDNNESTSADDLLGCGLV